MRSQKISARNAGGGNYSFSIETPLQERRIARAPRTPPTTNRVWSFLVKPVFWAALAIMPNLAEASPAEQPTPPGVESVDTNINKGEKPYYRPETDVEGTGMAPRPPWLLAQATTETPERLRDALGLLKTLVQTQEKITPERKEDLLRIIDDAKARLDRREVVATFTRVALELMRTTGANATTATTQLTNFTGLGQVAKEAVADARKQLEDEAKWRKESEERAKANRAKYDYAGALATKLDAVGSRVSNGARAEAEALARELREKTAGELTDEYLTQATRKTAELMMGAGIGFADVQRELRAALGTLPNAVVDAALQPLARASGTPRPAAARTAEPRNETERMEARLMAAHDAKIKSEGFRYIAGTLPNPSDRQTLLESRFVSEEAKQALKAYNLSETVKTGHPIATEEEAKLLAEYRAQLPAETRGALETYERVEREKTRAAGFADALETKTGAKEEMDYLARLSPEDYELLKKYEYFRVQTQIDAFEKAREKKELEGIVAELAPQIIGLQADALLRRREFAERAGELAALREKVANIQPKIGEEVDAGNSSMLRTDLEQAKRQFEQIKEELRQTREGEREAAQLAAVEAQATYVGRVHATAEELKRNGVEGLAYGQYKFLKDNERLLDDEARALLKAYEYSQKIERGGESFLASLIASGEIGRVFALSDRLSREARRTLEIFEVKYKAQMRERLDERIGEAGERLGELRVYLNGEYGIDVANEFLEKWDKKLQALRELDVTSVGGLRQALALERQLMGDMPTVEILKQQAVMADRDAKMVERLLAPGTENELMYTVTPQWIGLMRARARAIQENSGNMLYGQMYRMRMEREHPEVNAQTLFALATFFEQQQMLFAETLEQLRLQLQTEPPNAAGVRIQLARLRTIADDFTSGNADAFAVTLERITAGMSEEERAATDLNALRRGLIGSATNLISEYNLRERTLCSFYSSWHGTNVDEYLDKLDSVASDWETYSERRETFRNVTTQRAALEASGRLPASVDAATEARIAAFRQNLRGAFGYAGTTSIAGADLDSRFANVSAEGQQRIMSEMEAKYGANWQQNLNPTMTRDNYDSANVLQSQTLLQLQGLVSKYDRTVYGGDVYNNFLALNYDAQYAFLELASRHYKAAFESLPEEELRKVDVLLGRLQGIPRSHQALLLATIGDKMLDEAPETIDAVMGAVAGYSEIFAQGYPKALSEYYASLPNKLGKLTTDAFALKESVKPDPKSVVILMPSEQQDYVQLFYPSAQVALRVPKPIYTAHQEYFQSVILSSPPDFLRGQATQPGLYEVERVYFEEDMLKLVVSQPVTSITLPILLTRLERLAPDWIPPVGALENLLLATTGTHTLTAYTQTSPPGDGFALSDSQATHGVGGQLQADWYGGNARLDLRIDEQKGTTLATQTIPGVPPHVEVTPTENTTTVGTMTVRNMGVAEDVLGVPTGGGLLQVDGEVNATGSAISGDLNWETLMLKTVQNMAGGAQRAVFMQRESSGTQEDDALYAAYYFERLSNGSFWLADVQTMTFEEQQARFGFSRAELNGEDKATKLYAQIHPAVGGHEFEIEGCLLLSGEFGGTARPQGVGAAYQQPAGRGAGEGWGFYGLYGTGPSGTRRTVTRTETGEDGSTVEVTEQVPQREERLVVGVNNVGTPEETQGDFWTRQRFWTGRVYATVDAEEDKLQFEGWLAETQRFRAKFFLGETFAEGEQQPVGGALVDYRAEWGTVGAGGMYTLTQGTMRTGGKAYYVSPSLTNYLVGSVLLDKIRAGEATFTGGTREEEERFIGALGARTDFPIPWLEDLGLYAKGVGGITKLSASQSLRGGAIALGKENGFWVFRSAEARGAYFEIVDDVEGYERVRAQKAVGGKVVVDITEGHTLGVEGYAPGFGEAKYTLSLGNFDLLTGSRPELDLVAGLAFPHERVRDEVKFAGWGGARLRLNPGEAWSLVGSVEKARREGETADRLTQQTAFIYRTQLIPESVYESGLWALAGITQAYQQLGDGVHAVQVDVQGGLHWTDAGLRSFSLNLGGFVWERWAYPGQVTTDALGIPDDRRYRLGATLTAAYNDRLGRLGIVDLDLPVSVFALVQPYAEGTKFTLTDLDVVHIDYTLNVRLSY